jgi:biotin transporter BioY
MDLALIAPLAFLAGVLLLRRTAWGYLLASIAVLKGLTMALGVSAMGINMALQGDLDSLGILIPFLVLTALNLISAVLLLRNVDVSYARQINQQAA